MWDLQHIRRHLDLDRAKLLAIARLNCCNSLLHGIADSYLTGLYRIDLHTWEQGLFHLLSAFYCSVPFIGCQKGLEYCLRSICWPTKPCVKSSLFIYAPCLPHRFLLVRWDQTTMVVCQSLGSRTMLVQDLFTLVPHLSLEQSAAVCPFSQFSCYLQEISEDTSLWFGLSP